MMSSSLLNWKLKATVFSMALFGTLFGSDDHGSALPDALLNGRISGVCARGGFEIAFEWKDGILLKVEVLSKAGKRCRLKYGDDIVEFDTQRGKIYYLDGSLKCQYR